jgi:hypothetical protein
MFFPNAVKAQALPPGNFRSAHHGTNIYLITSHYANEMFTRFCNLIVQGYLKGQKSLRSGAISPAIRPRGELSGKSDEKKKNGRSNCFAHEK